MDLLTPELFRQLVLQMPFAGAGLLAAWYFQNKSEIKTNKLISVFEKSLADMQQMTSEEVTRCEARYTQVFSELMRIKEKLNRS